MTKRLPCAGESPRVCTAAICPMPVMIPVNMAWIVAGFGALLRSPDASKSVAALDAGENTQVWPHPAHGVETQCQPLRQRIQRRHVGHADGRGPAACGARLQQQLIDQVPPGAVHHSGGRPASTCNSFAMPAMHPRSRSRAGKSTRPSGAWQVYHGGPTRSQVLPWRAKKSRVKMA